MFIIVCVFILHGLYEITYFIFLFHLPCFKQWEWLCEEFVININIKIFLI